MSVPPLVRVLGKENENEDEEDEEDVDMCRGFSNDLWARSHGDLDQLLSQSDMWSHQVERGREIRRREAVGGSAQDESIGASIPLCNKIPIWNPEVGSLVVKFDRNRVTLASSKNFIVFHERDLKNEDKTTSDAILQVRALFNGCCRRKMLIIPPAYFASHTLPHSHTTTPRTNSQFALVNSLEKFRGRHSASTTRSRSVPCKPLE